MWQLTFPTVVLYCTWDGHTDGTGTGNLLALKLLYPPPKRAGLATRSMFPKGLYLKFTMEDYYLRELFWVLFDHSNYLIAFGFTEFIILTTFSYVNILRIHILLEWEYCSRF